MILFQLTTERNKEREHDDVVVVVRTTHTQVIITRATASILRLFTLIPYCLLSIVYCLLSSNLLLITYYLLLIGYCLLWFHVRGYGSEMMPCVCVVITTTTTVAVADPITCYQ